MVKRLHSPHAVVVQNHLFCALTWSMLPFRALSRASKLQGDSARLKSETETIKADLWKAMLAEEQKLKELLTAQQLMADQKAEVGLEMKLLGNS